MRAKPPLAMMRGGLAGSAAAEAVRDDALDNAVDKADVTRKVETTLQVADSVGADDFRWALDVDAAQPCRPIEERIGAQAKAGCDCAAEILAASGDDLKLCCGAEIDHDAWAAILLICGNAVGVRSAPSSLGVVDEQRHSGLDAGLDEERLDVEIRFADLAER